MSRDLQRLTRAGQWDEAFEALNQLEQETGPSLGLAFNKLSIMERAGKNDDASALRTEIVELAWDQPKALNQLAWGIATSNRTEQMDLALRAAERASELSNHEDAAILDTVARVYYELGNLDEAIRWQRQAVEKNTGHKEIDATLEEYLSEQAGSGQDA